jgi:hypothetical protein
VEETAGRHWYNDPQGTSTAFLGNDAEKMQYIDVIGILFERLSVQRLRISPAARRAVEMSAPDEMF